jgi:hypothetical protein
MSRVFLHVSRCDFLFTLFANQLIFLSQFNALMRDTSQLVAIMNMCTQRLSWPFPCQKYAHVYRDVWYRGPICQQTTRMSPLSLRNLTLRALRVERINFSSRQTTYIWAKGYNLQHTIIVVLRNPSAHSFRYIHENIHSLMPGVGAALGPRCMQVRGICCIQRHLEAPRPNVSLHFTNEGSGKGKNRLI